MCGGGIDYGGAAAKNALRGGLSEVGGYDAACEETWLNTTAWFLSVTALLGRDQAHFRDLGIIRHFEKQPDLQIQTPSIKT
jgi:hypothetical protein